MPEEGPRTSLWLEEPRTGKMKDGTTQRLFYRENRDEIGYAAPSRPLPSRRGAEWTC